MGFRISRDSARPGFQPNRNPNVRQHGFLRASIAARGVLRPRSDCVENVPPNALPRRPPGLLPEVPAIVDWPPSHDVSLVSESGASPVCYLPSFMRALKLLVIANPTAGYLKLLEQIAEPVDIQA